MQNEWENGLNDNNSNIYSPYIMCHSVFFLFLCVLSAFIWRNKDMYNIKTWSDGAHGTVCKVHTSAQLASTIQNTTTQQLQLIVTCTIFLKRPNCELSVVEHLSPMSWHVGWSPTLLSVWCDGARGVNCSLVTVNTGLGGVSFSNWVTNVSWFICVSSAIKCHKSSGWTPLGSLQCSPDT